MYIFFENVCDKRRYDWVTKNADTGITLGSVGIGYFASIFSFLTLLLHTRFDRDFPLHRYTV